MAREVFIGITFQAKADSFNFQYFAVLFCEPCFHYGSIVDKELLKGKREIACG